MRRLLTGWLITACITSLAGCNPKPPVPNPPAPNQGVEDDRNDKNEGGAADANSQDPGGTSTSSWSEQRDKRATEHREYIASNNKGYEWFAHASNGLSGVPFIFVRLLPELEPEIWGEPEEEFARFGFFRTQADADRPLPTGLAWDTLITAPSNGESALKLHTVTLACSACHIGRVRINGNDDKDIYLELVGGPNTQSDVRKWRHAFELTVAKRLSNPEEIQKTVEEVIKLVDAKEPGYFYREWPGYDKSLEAQQRELFKATAAKLIPGIAQAIQVGRYAVDKELQTNYSKPNHPPLDGGTPGQSDGSGDLIPKLLLFAELAKNRDNPAEAIQTYLTTDYDALPRQLATTTDNLSTWSQSTHSLAQIDGSVKSPFFRNIAAILAIAGRPDLVNVQNADISGEFIKHLSPPPYPFDVDLVSAARGELLFNEHCAVCHYPNSTEVYQTLTTDSNRSRVLQPATFGLFLQNFLASVPEDYTYETQVDGATVTVQPRSLEIGEVLIDRSNPEKQGYLAGALEGAWARAPYLHNGSVPTLRHLLAPQNPESKRPAQFVRGCVSYDTTNVGFVWQLDKLDAYRVLDPVAAVYDTHWDGCSNGGHDTDLVVQDKKRKLDWSGDENRDSLNDLLEYLKTL
jgi:hypothetical protein